MKEEGTREHALRVKVFCFWLESDYFEKLETASASEL